jgi:hypothetical protein
MLGSDFKRGVTTTLERVFNASDWTFSELSFQWCGKGASINFSEDFGISQDFKAKRALRARFTFPNIDDNKVIPQKTLPKFIGMVLHELGHAWFTDNNPWDKHEDNPTLCRLINGLEDPRIERKVIESGIAANAAPLFENLINEMMGGSYCEPNDFQNIAFQLAVEGRRMNGYRIALPPVYTKSRYRVPIQWALDEAHKAQSTAEIVVIAVELLKRLNAIKPPPPPPPPPGEQPPCEEGEREGPPDGPNPGDGEGPSQGPSDGPGEGEGEGEGEKPAGGKGGERPIEPDLEDELKPHACTADEYTPRPTWKTPTIYNFNWE